MWRHIASNALTFFIVALFLSHPFAAQGLVAWLQASQLWLAAVQSLASLAMGAFYVQRKSG